MTEFAILVAQLTETESAIRGAVSHGWEAGLVAVVLVASIAALSWLVRSWMNQAAERENRMAARIDKLEEWQTRRLEEMAQSTTRALEMSATAASELRIVVSELREALIDRPCLLPEQVAERARQREEERAVALAKRGGM